MGSWAYGLVGIGDLVGYRDLGKVEAGMFGSGMGVRFGKVAIVGMVLGTGCFGIVVLQIDETGHQLVNDNCGLDLGMSH
jgi:hypothetical protein